MLRQPGLAWVHWAPPCGTFSRAREIRRPGAPPPLRNKTHIQGFPHLRGTHLARVRSANALVEFMAAQCRALSASGICRSIENPTNSLMWTYPDLATTIATAHSVAFNACMHGSRRKRAPPSRPTSPGSKPCNDPATDLTPTYHGEKHPTKVAYLKDQAICSAHGWQQKTSDDVAAKAMPPVCSLKTYVNKSPNVLLQRNYKV